MNMHAHCVARQQWRAWIETEAMRFDAIDAAHCDAAKNPAWPA